MPLIENRRFAATYDRTSIKKGYGTVKNEFGTEIINVSDRGTMVTMCNLSVYLLLLTTLEVSALFLSLDRHCLCQFFVAVGWP